MARNDTTDFLAAFAVGTVLGIGATLLLRPEPSPRERIVRQLKPYRRELKRGYRQVRGGLGRQAEATGDFTGELIDAGKELLGEFRKEVSDILSDARGELGDMARGRGREAARAARRAGRKLGL
jgi:gas vesicle protein